MLKFQFLIGRLKTAISVKSFINRCEFQFLIGRLKTKGHLLHSHGNLHVSIPDR